MRAGRVHEARDPKGSSAFRGRDSQNQGDLSGEKRVVRRSNQEHLGSRKPRDEGVLGGGMTARVRGCREVCSREHPIVMLDLTGDLDGGGEAGTWRREGERQREGGRGRGRE